jgi:hypothetical protein
MRPKKHRFYEPMVSRVSDTLRVSWSFLTPFAAVSFFI